MPLGYRVGEPQEQNAIKVIRFEVNELGNTHLLTEISKKLHVEPYLDPITSAIEKRFGRDATAMWLCDTLEQAKDRYGKCGEPYGVVIPEDAIMVSNLGDDGKLWLWKTPKSEDTGILNFLSKWLVTILAIALALMKVFGYRTI